MSHTLKLVVEALPIAVPCGFARLGKWPLAAAGCWQAGLASLQALGIWIRPGHSIPSMARRLIKRSIKESHYQVIRRALNASSNDRHVYAIPLRGCIIFTSIHVSM